MDPTAVIALIWIILPFVFLVLWLRARRRSNRLSAEKKTAITEAATLSERFAPVLSIESEIKRLRDEADSVRLATDQVRITYADKRMLLDQLEQQIAVFDERLAFSELGVYAVSYTHLTLPTKRIV